MTGYGRTSNVAFSRAFIIAVKKRIFSRISKSRGTCVSFLVIPRDKNNSFHVRNVRKSRVLKIITRENYTSRKLYTQENYPRVNIILAWILSLREYYPCMKIIRTWKIISELIFYTREHFPHTNIITRLNYHAGNLSRWKIITLENYYAGNLSSEEIEITSWN